MVGEPVGTVIKSDAVPVSDRAFVMAELTVLALNKAVPGMNARAEFRVYLVSENESRRETLFHPPTVVLNNMTTSAYRVQLPPHVYNAMQLDDRIQIRINDGKLLRFQRRGAEWAFIGESRCGPNFGWGGLGPIPKITMLGWDKIEHLHPNGERDVINIDQNGVPWLNGKVYGYGMFVPWKRELWGESSSVNWPQSKKARLTAQEFRDNMTFYHLPRDENGVAIVPEPPPMPSAQAARKDDLSTPNAASGTAASEATTGAGAQSGSGGHRETVSPPVAGWPSREKFLVSTIVIGLIAALIWYMRKSDKANGPHC